MQIMASRKVFCPTKWICVSCFSTLPWSYCRYWNNPRIYCNLQRVLLKARSALSQDDRGCLAEKYPTLYAIHVDKDYHGLADIIRAIRPINRRANGRPLSADERKFNRDLSTDRVIVEILFDRLQNLCNGTKQINSRSEDDNNLYFRLCCGFKNYHIFLHPLKNKDGHSYRRWRKVIYYDSLETSRRRNKQRRKSTMERKERQLTADIRWNEKYVDRAWTQLKISSQSSARPFIWSAW